MVSHFLSIPPCCSLSSFEPHTYIKIYIIDVTKLNMQMKNQFIYMNKEMTLKL